MFCYNNYSLLIVPLVIFLIGYKEMVCLIAKLTPWVNKTIFLDQVYLSSSSITLKTRAFILYPVAIPFDFN